jgi:transcription antitermination factor NusG
MNKGNQVENIIKELQSLQLRQKVLITQLGKLATSDNTTVQTDIGEKEVLPKTPTVARQFKIGDRVRIKNPRVFQTSTGTVAKIGENRITVRTPSGSKIVRAHKNLSFE